MVGMRCDGVDNDRSNHDRIAMLQPRHPMIYWSEPKSKCFKLFVFMFLVMCQGSSIPASLE